MPGKTVRPSTVRSASFCDAMSDLSGGPRQPDGLQAADPGELAGTRQGSCVRSYRTQRAVLSRGSRPIDAEWREWPSIQNWTAARGAVRTVCLDSARSNLLSTVAGCGNGTGSSVMPRSPANKPSKSGSSLGQPIAAPDIPTACDNHQIATGSVTRELRMRNRCAALKSRTLFRAMRSCASRPVCLWHTIRRQTVVPTGSSQLSR